MWGLLIKQLSGNVKDFKCKPSLQIGLTLSLHDIQALPGGEAAADKEWGEEFSHYLPYIKDDDFLGVQNYTRSVYGANGLEPNPEDAKTTQMGYENYPEALEHVIRRVHDDIENSDHRDGEWNCHVR